MQKIKQDTITIANVDIMDIKTLTSISRIRVYAKDVEEAQKIAFDEFMRGVPEDKKKAEKSRVFARVDGEIEKYRVMCSMNDFINLCFDYGTTEKIEDTAEKIEG